MKALGREDIRIVKCSNFYQTEPVPKSDQPWFVNAVISVETSLGALELLDKLHEIEQNMGRVRLKKWEARIIDLDLLCYHDEIYPDADNWQKEVSNPSSDKPVIPHGRLHEREFVLIPISDFNKSWQHPVFKENIEKLLNDLESVGIVRLL